MVKEQKLKAVEELKKSLEDSNVICLVDMHKLPSKQLQEIRKALRGKAKIKMIAKIILKFAIEGANKSKIKDMESHIPTQPAIILTDMAAFKFFNLVDSMRFKTFAKEGDVANEDIWVSAGPTNLLAGPVISELQQAGVPASIEGGKISIRKDACVAKKGEALTSLKTSILRKLNVEPMEVVMNIVAIYDNGDIYTKSSLELTKAFPQMLVAAYSRALNLSIFIEFPTKENITQLIAKAARAANAIKAKVDAANASAAAPATQAATGAVETNSSDNSIEKKDEHGGAS